MITPFVLLACLLGIIVFASMLNLERFVLEYIDKEKSCLNLTLSYDGGDRAVEGPEINFFSYSVEYIYSTPDRLSEVKAGTPWFRWQRGGGFAEMRSV